MLAQRIATAAVLVPLIVAGIIWLPTGWVTLIFVLLLAIGAWEWARFPGGVSVTARGLFTSLYALCALAFVWPGNGFIGGGPVAAWLLGLACVWWLGCVYWLLRFPAGWDRSMGRRDIGTASGLLVLCAAAIAVRSIHDYDHGHWLLLMLLMLVWGADTGAYCAGRTLGRHRLAPAISPGKTIEGAVGGIVAALVVATIGAVLLGYDGGRLVAFVLLGCWIAVVSIVGDLTLSMYKRYAGLKDTGGLFPGHGGVLDRVDSLLAAAPWFAIGLAWLARG